MRILMAHKFFERRGGGEVMFFETGRVLEENGHDVGYFATSTDPSQADGVRTFLVSPPEYEHGPLIGRVAQIGRMVYSRSVKERFAEAIRTFKPDVVHVWSIQTHLTPSILAAAHEAGVPIVMVCNDYKHICPNYKLYHHGRICTDCKGGRFYMAVANRCCKNSLTFSVASALEAYVHDLMGVYNYVDTFLFASNFIAHETEAVLGVALVSLETASATRSTARSSHLKRDTMTTRCSSDDCPRRRGWTCCSKRRAWLQTCG